MMTSFPTTILLLLLTCCGWLRPTSPQQPAMNQFQQYQMQMANRMNGRGVQSVAFMMTTGHANTRDNLTQYITFINTPLSNNARLFAEFAAMETTTAGLYLLNYRIVGNPATRVDLKHRRNSTGTLTTLATAASLAGQQITADCLVMLAVNDAVYLEIITGTIANDTAGTTSLQSFMGMMLVWTQNNPFLDNVFPNNNGNNNNNLERSLDSSQPSFV